MWNGILPSGISPHDCILYLDFRSNSAIDRISGVSYSDTSVAYSGDRNNSTVAAFDGSTSFIDCGSELAGATALTVCLFTDMTDHGEGNFGRFLDNGKLICEVNDTDDKFSIYSDGSTAAIAKILYDPND